MSSPTSSTNLPVLCTKPAAGERSICPLSGVWRHLFGPRSSSEAWLLLLLSTADFWSTGPAITPHNLIYRLQHCFPKAHPSSLFLAGYFYAAKFLCSTKLYPAEGIFVTNISGASFPSLSLCDLQFLFLIPVQRHHKCLSFSFPSKTCVVQRHDLGVCFCKQLWPQCYTKIHVTESACSSLS